MAFFCKEVSEQKAAYAERKTKENAEVGTLTAEQQDVLAGLCWLQYEIHNHLDRIFLTESCENPFFWQNYSSINEQLSECGLEQVSLPDCTWIPESSDYYSVLSDEERETWTLKANALGIDGYDLWYEESGVVNEYYDNMREIKNNIEIYLKSIDKKHGTKYGSAGANRVF